MGTLLIVTFQDFMLSHTSKTLDQHASIKHMVSILQVTKQ